MEYIGEGIETGLIKLSVATPTNVRSCCCGGPWACWCSMSNSGGCSGSTCWASR